MASNHKYSSFRQAGFSLIEILVGLVIGLLATLVIMQVFAVFEGQKRTTTGVADAQINGSIALYSMARELQMAGYGLLPNGVIGVADSPIECTALNIDIPTGNIIGIDPASGIAAAHPAIITDGGNTANNTDSITIHYGSSDMGGNPSLIGAIPNSTTVTIDSDLGCQNNDVALFINGAACALGSVASVVPAVAASGIRANILLNSALPVEAAIGANFACLGSWNEITYQVNNGILERRTQTGTEPIIAGIVNIQAQYGISNAANSNQVVQWVDATGSWAAASITPADRNRIKAIRVAIVARNGLLEKEEVSSACDSVTSDQPFGLCAWSGTSLMPINASPAPWIVLSDDPDGTSWKRYRYRVFETVIPLRNMLWSNLTL